MAYNNQLINIATIATDRSYRVLATASYGHQLECWQLLNFFRRQIQQESAIT